VMREEYTARAVTQHSRLANSQSRPRMTATSSGLTHKEILK
jgi:hypothetical protein